MTERLYYENSDLRSFSARVLACEKTENGYDVRLDRSAFYPTSGGQPFDTGTLGGARVTDVNVTKDGDVSHIVDRPLPVGETVTGEIDWARRFDHMQQHAGDHMLAGAIWKAFGGVTIGLHLGAEVSTIDVHFEDGRARLPQADLRALEDTVNGWIQANLPIRCWFPSPEELAALPLRKAPTVHAHVRVVQVGDVECVACGGTHPSTSGQLGLFKILDARPSKGNVRFSFVCGMRAIRYFQTCAWAAESAAALLSTGVDALPDAVETGLQKLKDAEYQLKKERLDKARAAAAYALRDAPTTASGARVARASLPGLNQRELAEAAAALNADVVALFAGGEGDAAPLVFARGADVKIDMGKLLKEAAAAAGGKGGGRADFAQGAGNGRAALDFAFARLTEGEA